MKKLNDHVAPILGRPREIWVRLVSFGYLVGMAASPIILLIGIACRRPSLIAAGLLSLAVAGLCHNWLRRHHEIDDGPHVLDEITGLRPPAAADGDHPLVPLLQAWAALERQRGTPAFDPWALQAIRRDIRGAIKADPALTHLFYS